MQRGNCTRERERAARFSSNPSTFIAALPMSALFPCQRFTTDHCLELSEAPSRSHPGTAAGMPKMYQSNTTTCRDTNRIRPDFASRWPPAEKASGYGIGIGHVEHEDDVGPSRSWDFSRKLRKKPWRLQGVLSNHLGNEFKKACTI